MGTAIRETLAKLSTKLPAGIATTLSIIRASCLPLLLSISLSGCIDYDMAIHYRSPNQGEFVQHIQSDRLQTLTSELQQHWIKAIEQTTQKLGGRLQRDPNGLEVVIPFSSSADLEKKFNQFYNGLGQSALIEPNSGIPAITGHLAIQRSNFILVERNRLRYDIDLRSLGVRSVAGDVLVSPTSLINLEFKLDTPWGSRNNADPTTLKPRSLKDGKKLIWALIPGEENLVDTTFWMPNFIGLGSIAILLFVLLGRFLKYPQTSDILNPPPQQASH
ncbi:DUF3153 domain-containing protein [Phormidium sp. CLA17]|nr:DUF3153 domain-containing protein [Leptolyngbya sp. Cla-17]